MATIRVRDWTKERIEEIREAESHSSHDSVIKSLLKDRQLAQFASAPTPEAEPDEDPPAEPPDTAFDDLTVLAEVTHSETGVFFLWCPNCGNELVHVGFDDPVSVTVMELDCQRCLTRLDQHAIVEIDIGYPVEERNVEGTLDDDLRTCVVDYWDRTLRTLADGSHADDEQLVWEFARYAREFDWEWPADVPVVGLQEGMVLYNEATDEYLAVVERTSDNRNALDSYLVRTAATADGVADGPTEELAASAVTNLLVSRSLYPAAGGSGEDR